MDISQEIRLLLVRSGNISESELSRRINMSRQNLFHKMKKNDFKLSELEEIAKALEYEINITFTPIKNT